MKKKGIAYLAISTILVSNIIGIDVSAMGTSNAQSYMENMGTLREQNVEEQTQYNEFSDGNKIMGENMESDCEITVKAANANATSDFSGGDGTKENPFKVKTFEQLKKIKNYRGKHFIQTANIDCGGKVLQTMFSENLPFTGTYNGCNYSISNLILIKSNYRLGIFGEAGTESVLKNIRLNNISANISTSEKLNAGALVGESKGTITGCQVRKVNFNITDTSGEINACGGLAGRVLGIINKSKAYNITIGTTRDVGGLAGAVTENGIIEDCYVNNISINATGGAGASVGSLNNATANNCIAAGNLQLNGSWNYDNNFGYVQNVIWKHTSTDKINISKAKISGIQKVYEYTGNAIKPVPIITLDNQQLIANEDYDISYKNNRRVGTATIIITGKGKYNGSRNIKFSITALKGNIEKSAVSFANIFSKKAKSSESTASSGAKQQLKKLGNQLIITGYKGKIPDEVLEAFATAVLNTINNSNINKYETNQNKLVEQIYKQIKGGLKSGSKKIVLGKGSKSITYTVEYTILAQSFGGIGAQVSWANVTWRDAKNKTYSVHIVASSKNENMKKALASYCAVLAQLNKDVWKDFLTKYITDGWKLAGLNSIKKLDDKTVSKFFDRSEKMILMICGDKKAKNALVNDAGGTLKKELVKMTKTQFRNFVKNNVPDGDKLITAADQYKKVIDKYNDYKLKIAKWEKTKKASDLTKSEKAYQECQILLETLNDSLNKMS